MRFVRLLQQAERAGVRMEARRAQTAAGTARAGFTTADPKGARPERKGISQRSCRKPLSTSGRGQATYQWILGQSSRCCAKLVNQV